MLYLNIGLTVLALIEHQYLINSLASIYNCISKSMWP